MLFVSSDTSHRPSLYIQTLSKLLRLPEFKDVQLISTNQSAQLALNLPSLPLLLDDQGEKILSVQGITERLCEMVNKDRILIGNDGNDKSNTFKWFDLKYDLE